MLGVSGTTVRRWEAGQLRPTRDDLSRFSQACELAPLEEQFLVHAFQHREFEEPPSEGGFQFLANQVLAVEHPGFIMDSLFFIRARNSYMHHLAGNNVTPLTNNALEGIFARMASTQDANEAATLRLLRSFWLSTAGLTGSPPYVNLLSRLRAVEGFEDQWWRIAMTRDGTGEAANLPMDFNHPSNGRFRVLMTRLVLPPTYYLRQYVPLDDTAHSFLRRLDSDTANEVHAAAAYHWALGE